MRNKILGGPQQIQLPVAYAEDLPGPQLDGGKILLRCKCHNVGIVRLLWEPYDRVIIFLCAETGLPAFGVKVEKKNRLIVDLVRPPEISHEGEAEPERAH